MNTNGLLEVFGSLFPILFIGVIVIIITTNVRRSNKIKKLKSGEIASKEIKWTVSEIKYTPPWKNDSWIIRSRYIVAKATNPITNDEMEYESDTIPYKDTWFKIRWMWPTKEDIQNVFEYARRFIKEWDTVKIHASMENADIYYMEDISERKKENITENIIENKEDNTKIEENISNSIAELGKNIGMIWEKINIGWPNGDAWITKYIKIFKIYTSIAIWIFIGIPILIRLLKDTDWRKLRLPEIDWGMNIPIGWSYVLRSSIVLLIGFIIYKVIVWYRWIKK